MTRQRAYQLRHRAADRCERCSRKAITALHCARHRRLRNAAKLAAYYRRKAAA